MAFIFLDFWIASLSLAMALLRVIASDSEAIQKLSILKALYFDNFFVCVTTKKELRIKSEVVLIRTFVAKK